MDLQVFVQNVKRILDERRISYSRAGRESGAGIEFIRNMERKGSWPSTEKILKMADYLGISVSELLGEEKELAPKEDASMDKSAFVQNIKDICKKKGIKPTVACRESGVGTSFINNIEVRGQVPSVEKVQMLAAYLGVTTSELLGEEKEPTPVAEGGPVYPPEYDLLSSEDRALVDSMIRRLILEKNQEGASSPSNGGGGETA